MSAINREVAKATSEKLQRPDASLNSVLCDYVNKHPDKSELVANAVKERILENNTKIQMLALFLLDTLMKKCGFPFHSQVGAKPFMNVIIQLLNNKEISQQVKKKILQLIQHWGLRFEDDSDVLPLFSNVYSALKQRSLPFPSEDEAKVQVRKMKETSDGRAPMAESKPLDKKHKNLRKDLEVVIENIVLTNEMIDAHDIDDEVDENDALISLTQTLVSFEHKIMEIIEKIKNDEVMNVALQTNDDLQKTLKRYKRLEHGRVPEKFVPECRKYLASYKPETSAKPSKPVAEKPRQEVRRPEPAAKVSSKPPPPVEDDIFGFADSAPVNVAQPPQSVGSGKPQDIGGLFGDTFDAPSTGSSNFGGSDSSINKLNEIMQKMTLEKQEKEKAAQFATGMPGGGGFGGFGGPGPGMFNTGMPQPGGMFGGPGFGGPPMGGMGFGGPPMGPGPGNFATGFNQPPPGNFGGGFGGPPMGGMGFNNQDPFLGGGSLGGSSLFSTAAPNYNPGGGPQAFKNNPKSKPKQEGPKEFNQLFSMADKISDRTNQPINRVDDYVTSYKNNIGGADDMFGGGQPVAAPGNNNSDMFGGSSNAFAGANMGQSDDMFVAASKPQSYNNQSQYDDNNYGAGQSNDVYGGYDDQNYDDGYGNNAQPMSSQDDYGYGGDNYHVDEEVYGETSNEPSYMGGGNMFNDSQPSNTGNNYGGNPSAQGSTDHNKQEELFDIFG